MEWTVIVAECNVNQIVKKKKVFLEHAIVKSIVQHPRRVNGHHHNNVFFVFVFLSSQLESTCVSIHEILKVVSESQTWYRLREAHDRIRADHIQSNVTLWSLGETVLLFVIAVGQVVLLKSFFSEKKGLVAVPT